MNTMVSQKGINDMYKGWYSENEWNKKIYNLWHIKLMYVYNEKYHEKNPTYVNCTLCLEWHWLSKFVEDVVKIDGYNYEKFMNGELELDKDIKSNGKNKEYSLENCMFVSKQENIMQANRTRDYSYTSGKNHYRYKKHLDIETRNKISKTIKEKELSKGKNNPKAKKVAQYDLEGNLIKIWNYAKEISESLDINYSTLKNKLQKRNKTQELNGFIWKYYEGGDENE